jgi:hypothetical protein
MTVPPWLDEMWTLALQLAAWQQFGLAFLLGSFAVATLSDLKRLSAQREFVEIWLLFAVVVLGFDAWAVQGGRVAWPIPAVKWGRFGVLFRLAPADVAALAAAASLLSPLLVVLFYAVAKVLALALAPVLGRGQSAWPFMPVVTLATLAVLVLGWLW